jgi:polysaccharide export outer membrane protein
VFVTFHGRLKKDIFALMSKTPWQFLLMFSCIVFALLFSSCLSQKEFTYFQPKDSLQVAVMIDTGYKPVIHKYDMLSIYVSSISEEATKFFNFSAEGKADENTSANNQYVVDEKGNIQLPLTGAVPVEGLTPIEATEVVKQRLDKYLINPAVKLNISNFHVTVLGEVNKPGVYTVPNERITLTEALGMAGDLTLYGLRNNITVVREVNGKKEFAVVDITTRDFFASPYYHLQGNDIVYVEARTQKKFTVQNWYRIAPVFLSGLSLVVVLISLTK